MTEAYLEALNEKVKELEAKLTNAEAEVYEADLRMNAIAISSGNRDRDLENKIDDLEDRHTDHVYKIQLLVRRIFNGLKSEFGEDLNFDVGYDSVNHIERVDHLKDHINHLEHRINLLNQTVGHLQHEEGKLFKSLKKFEEIENRIAALESASPKKCYNIGGDNA